MTAPCTKTERLLVAVVVAELWRQNQDPVTRGDGPYTFNESLPEDATIGVDGRVDVLSLVRAVVGHLDPTSAETRDTVPMDERETLLWVQQFHEPAPGEVRLGTRDGRCIRCGSASGDDWSHCEGGPCPVPASPHFVG